MTRILTASVLALGLLAACSPTPTEIANTAIAPLKMGAPFKLDDCDVQAWRVQVTVPGNSSGIPSSSVFIANCPTAVVTSASSQVGKAPTNEVVVQPKNAAVSTELQALKAESAELAKRQAALQSRLTELESKSR